ncbi:cytochrome c oxidase subunit 3 [Marinomonas agarivorans]|nr:cytochrome c oxidase subunit 3 [Marinomonas agarivorans]
MKNTSEHYYVPNQSAWPIVATVALFFVALGAGLLLNSGSPIVLLIGFALLIYIFYGWFSKVVEESEKGLYSRQMDQSFRLGMAWFIFSEVMFFAAFFGALFYVRTLAIPWLNGSGSHAMTHTLLWPEFIAEWPLFHTPAANSSVPSALPDPFHLPLLNTILLVLSSVTLTISHHALKIGNRHKTINWLAITVLLGLAFLVVQGIEYYEAYVHLGLTLQSGIYGSTFFMLTGFHGLHVTLGTILLIVMLARMRKGHFSAEKHFAFEASAWYWHFVDVVWLGLFIFVYVL